MASVFNPDHFLGQRADCFCARPAAWACADSKAQRAAELVATHGSTTTFFFIFQKILPTAPC